MLLEDLLARPGLDPNLRLLMRAQVLIWPGDWHALDRCMRLAVAKKLARAPFEEMLLQAVLFFGFPRVVEAFGVLNDAWPSSASAGGGLAQSEQRAAGESLFAAIYGKNTDAVRSMLASCHGELHDFVLEAAYGRILARPGLEPLIRELLAVAALAAMQQRPQLRAHAAGARRFGASDAQLDEAIFTAIPEPQAAMEMQQLLRR